MTKYLLLLILLAGCASRSRLQQVGEALTATMLCVKVNRASILDLQDAMELNAQYDTRWGKCEKHGEWWVFSGAKIKANLCHDISVEIVAGILVCPEGHYIERILEGPKP